MKIAFVTDTGTGQHPDYWKEKGIYCLPLQITCDGESKDEYTEITYSEVIQKLHEEEQTQPEITYDLQLDDDEDEEEK